MKNNRTQNQQNPPLPKKKRVDTLGNSRYRVFAKSGNATMCIAKGLTKPGCDALIDNIIELTEKLGGQHDCNFIIIR